MLLRRSVIAVVLGVMPWATADRVAVWGDERRLWTEAVAHSPEKPRPWLQLGRIYALTGADGLAMQATRHAYDLSLDPRRMAVEGPMRGHDVAALNVAILHAARGQYAEALRWSERIQDRRAAAAGGSLVEVYERSWRHAQQQPAFSGF